MIPVAGAVSIDRLTNDVDRLHYLEHANIEPMPAVAQDRAIRDRWILVIVRIVAVLLHDHFKGITVVHFRVTLFAIAAQILIDTASTKDRTRGSIIDRHLGRQHADTGRAAHENRVRRQQRMIFRNDREQIIEKLLAFLQTSLLANQPSHRQR